jgi:hypothetical protein
MRVGSTFHEAAGFEAVDQARDVGGISSEPPGQLTHRNRLLDIQLM